MKAEIKNVLINHERKPVLHCPKCGSDKIWRIQRSVPEKIIYFLSEGKYVARKYHCRACKGSFLIHRDGKQPIDAEAIHLEEGGAPLISCDNCGKWNFTMSKFSPAEAKHYHSETDKTPFRKLICNNCMKETIIYLEDYEAANKNEI